MITKLTKSNRFKIQDRKCEVNLETEKVGTYEFMYWFWVTFVYEKDKQFNKNHVIDIKIMIKIPKNKYFQF